MKILNCLSGAVLVALFVTAGTAWGQARSQADVLIRSISAVQVPAASPYLSADVTVYSYWDDSAKNVVLTVLLPVEVNVLTTSAGCAAIPTTTSNGVFHPAVQCYLGTLQVGQSTTITITTTLPRLSNVRKTFGAFAWSLTPDPIPGNNYAEATAP